MNGWPPAFRAPCYRQLESVRQCKTDTAILPKAVNQTEPLFGTAVSRLNNLRLLVNSKYVHISDKRVFE